MPRNDDVDIPSITLDHDEVSERRVGASAVPPKRRLNPAPARPSAPAAQANTAIHYKKPSLFGVYLLLLLILAGALGAGYWLWQQNQLLLRELQLAKGEIENLDHQLLAADVSANKLGNTVEETLKIHDSEIRKLWGVSYDTNRKAIAVNSEKVADMEKKLANLRETVSTQAKLVAVQGNAFNEIEAGYNQLIVTVAAVDETQKNLMAQQTQLGETQQVHTTTVDAMMQKDSAVEGQLAAQKVQLDKVLADLDVLQSRYRALEQQVAQVRVAEPATTQSAVSAEVTRTLNEHQEAIASIDAFRAQIISNINALETQVQQLAFEQTLLKSDGL